MVHPPSTCAGVDVCLIIQNFHILISPTIIRCMNVGGRMLCHILTMEGMMTMMIFPLNTFPYNLYR